MTTQAQKSRRTAGHPSLAASRNRAHRADTARALAHDIGRAAENAARIDDNAAPGLPAKYGQAIRAVLRVSRYFREIYRTPATYYCGGAVLAAAREDCGGAVLAAARKARAFAEWRKAGGHIRTAYSGEKWTAGALACYDWYGYAKRTDPSAALACGLGINDGDPDEGTVRLLIVFDDCGDLDDIVGDGWNDDRSSVAARKREEKRAQDSGVWGVVAQYRVDADSPWQRCEDIDAEVWGFIGDDWISEPTEFMRAALDARAEAIAERDRQARHVSATADAVALVREIADYPRGATDPADADYNAELQRTAARIVARLDGSAPDSIARGER